MSLFDEPLSLESLSARIEVLEAALLETTTRNRTECPPELRQAWSLWAMHKAGSRWTAAAKKVNLSKLVELAGKDGELAIQIVEQAILGGWAGLFPLRQQERQSPSVVRTQTKQEAMKESETPLQRALAHAAQQNGLGAFSTEADYRAEVARIKEKYA